MGTLGRAVPRIPMDDIALFYERSDERIKDIVSHILYYEDSTVLVAVSFPDATKLEEIKGQGLEGGLVWTASTESEDVVWLVGSLFLQHVVPQGMISVLSWIKNALSVSFGATAPSMALGLALGMGAQLPTGEQAKPKLKKRVPKKKEKP